MTNEIDLYLTSDGFLVFAGSTKLAKIRRVRIGLFYYLFLTTKNPVIIDKIPCRNFLLTKWYLYVGQNYLNNLPQSYDTYIGSTNSKGQVICGQLIAGDTWLHTGNQ